MFFKKSEPSDQSVKIYAEIGAYERHFNAIQSIYRGMASTWLVAAFTAIGFVLFKEDKPSVIVFSPELIIAYIALFACIGMLMVWNLDVKVYHRLLVACFSTGKKYEDSNFLPKIRTAMDLNKESIGNGLVVFYLFGILSLLIIAIYFICSACPDSYPIAYGFSIFLAIFIVGVSIYMIRQTKIICLNEKK